MTALPPDFSFALPIWTALGA